MKNIIANPHSRKENIHFPACERIEPDRSQHDEQYGEFIVE